MKNIANSLRYTIQQIRNIEQKYELAQGSVKLLAVSKTRSSQEIEVVSQAGQTDFAENYVQEAVEKIKSINNPELIWHFIGPIQSNKTRQIAEFFNWVHTIDRLKIARRLNDDRPDDYLPLNVCIQINISGETSKAGIALDEVEELARSMNNLPRLKLRGLMTLPAPCAELEQQRRPFSKLRQCFYKLRSTYPDMDTLSMGTTNDMEAAIAEGATIVRIGTGIFGPRN
jgi:pyridoxal phosphate enzyme (YggS family)